MTIFYHPKAMSGELITLNEEESRHCARTLRMNKGDMCMVMNGKGGMFQAEVYEPRVNSCTLMVKDESEVYSPDIAVHIAIAPTKNADRFEWFLEKSTELGIARITPLICKHSERRKLRIDRLEKIILSAAKQSQKAFLPQLDELTPFDTFIEQSRTNLPDNRKYIAHCYENNKKFDTSSLKIDKGGILVMIGPEGDFAVHEIEMATKEGFRELNLGEARLRTETAGFYAVSAIHTLHGFKNHNI